MFLVLLWQFACLGLVEAIAVTELPICAQQCLSNSTSAQKSCSVIDIACLCSSSTYVASLSCCLYTECNASEQALAIQFNKEECANVNETAPDFVGCSPAGLSSALASMSITFSPTASSSVTSSTSGSVNPSITTLSGDPISETAANPTGKQITITTYAGAPLMTGSCTVPHFAVVTDPVGRVTAFPEVGCSPDRPDCCPFPDGLNGAISRCPQDYFTTANACCPLGYQIYYTNIGWETPCYSVPATSYVPASTPTVASLTLITDHVFSQKYPLLMPAQKPSFPPGAKIAIPVSIWAFIMIVCAGVFFYVRKKRRARRAAEANRVTTFPPEEPAMPHMSMSRAATMHELDISEGRAVSPSATPANGWPMFTAQSPPAYDPSKAAPSPIIAKQPPIPQELPGSTFIHEHHPAYSPAGTSAGTPTEPTAGSAPGTPEEQKSPVLSSATPRSETHSPVFVSPMGSPRLPKTG
ncbi:hypothetical protein G647_10262 [Cladophialophora carrionii CBS 160.54]|uniref:CFEM domain-containing protein n=1 Tax=Cladophialophora carrionii CBS 160.54 TaxID=1279043 RepID=V9DLJ5_9EURO|nr:uncharacterized protein G647_10262 [Cladophialophora carrionii CBS 160.54]ETI26817.1 hypothetical protein G647_10262 [Cladophialophora carrionii CBS 160.54]